MILDSEEQRGHLLELLARVHRTPEEVPAVEAVRTAIAKAAIMGKAEETPE